jgi:hypothetical protein
MANQNLAHGLRLDWWTVMAERNFHGRHATSRRVEPMRRERPAASRLIAQQRRVGFASKDLTDGPLLMNPEALAQSPLENLPGAALGQLAC